MFIFVFFFISPSFEKASCYSILQAETEILSGDNEKIKKVLVKRGFKNSLNVPLVSLS